MGLHGPMAALQGAQPAQASWVTWHSQGDSELRSTIIRQGEAPDQMFWPMGRWLTGGVRPVPSCHPALQSSASGSCSLAGTGLGGACDGIPKQSCAEGRAGTVLCTAWLACICHVLVSSATGSATHGWACGVLAHALNRAPLLSFALQFIACSPNASRFCTVSVLASLGA